MNPRRPGWVYFFVLETPVKHFSFRLSGGRDETEESVFYFGLFIASANIYETSPVYEVLRKRLRNANVCEWWPLPSRSF